MILSLITISAIQQDAFAQVTDTTILVEGSNEIIDYNITGGILLSVTPDCDYVKHTLSCNCG